MKICHIGNPGSLTVKCFVEHFSERGHEVHTFGWGEYPFGTDPNIIHHDLSLRKRKAESTGSQGIRKVQGGQDDGSGRKATKLRLLFDLYEFLRIRMMVNSIRPDIVHGHEASGNGYTTASLRRFPTVLTCWGSDINKFPWESKWVHFKVDRALRKVDVVHVTNETFGQTIVEKFGIDRGKIRCLRIGIDTNQFSRDKIDPERLERLRKEIGVEKGDLVILYPAGFRDKELQNYVNLVKAFAGISKRYPRSKLVMLSYNRRSGYEEIKEVLDTNDLWDRVRIVDQYLPQEDMPYVYMMTDIMVLIHDVDQLAASIAESMLMGTVLLMSRIKTYEREFEEGTNVIFTDQKDPSDIEDRLSYMIDHHGELVEKFRERNIALMKERHSRDSLMGGIEDMYRSLIASK